MTEPSTPAGPDEHDAMATEVGDETVDNVRVAAPQRTFAFERERALPQRETTP